MIFLYQIEIIETTRICTLEADDVSTLISTRTHAHPRALLVRCEPALRKCLVSVSQNNQNGLQNRGTDVDEVSGKYLAFSLFFSTMSGFTVLEKLIVILILIFFNHTVNIQ